MPFSSIKGQDRPVGIIKTYIENLRLEGGYLFSGPEGVGKKMTALALAERLNCLAPQADSCGICASCLKIESNRHPDVHMISSDEPQIKIDEIRQLQKDISLKAYEGGYKVFIIDNAHTMTAEASNCLLKVLEEPPRKSLIILVSDKPKMLFKTIISRCKILKFLTLERSSLEKILRQDYRLSPDLAHFAAYFSDGSLGRALKLKDDDILSKKNDLIDRFVLGGRHNLEGVALENRRDVRVALNLLAAWFRDVYLVKVIGPACDIINSDRRKELERSAGSLSFSDLDIIMANISAAISYLERNVNTRLLMYNLGMELWKN